jgi:hypothetical protein
LRWDGLADSRRQIFIACRSLSKLVASVNAAGSFERINEARFDSEPQVVSDFIDGKAEDPRR